MNQIIVYIYLMFLPLSILGSCLIIYTYIRYKDLRKAGANIVFCQSICDLVDSGKYLATAILTLSSLNQTDRDSATTLPCFILAFVGQSSAIATTAWNFMLNILVAWMVFKADHMRQGSEFPIKYCHIYVWGSTLALSLIPIHQYGPTSVGCWIKGPQNLYRLTFLVSIGLYVAVSIVIMSWILHKIRRDKVLSTQHHHFISEL
eukprot:TRINITY_DN5450_c0_g1_i4.p1 TRINITY_DN5450_c0_g1~~TRINITY_DN5450_c0_g1_i4.p1  ORF type:complete len:204 (-),score=17.18 TRINITY_DN5450_c0_g1_i4:367-978(-)